MHAALSAFLLVLYCSHVVLGVDPFTAGNFIITRSGDKGKTKIRRSAKLTIYPTSAVNAPASSTSSSNALFIDEYTPSGVLVQSLPLPYVQANSYFFNGSIHIKFIIFTKKKRLWMDCECNWFFH